MLRSFEGIEHSKWFTCVTVNCRLHAVKGGTIESHGYEHTHHLKMAIKRTWGYFDTHCVKVPRHVKLALGFTRDD